MGDPGPDRITRRRLVWLTIAALAARAAALVLTARIPCLLDECSYLTLARELAGGGGFRPHAGHYWPPGYIASLAALFAAGGDVLAAKSAQVIISTLLVPLTFVCAASAARPLGVDLSRRAALTAAALVAFDPTLIAFSHYIWPETLFLPLFLGGLLLVSRAAERLRERAPAGSHAAGAGVVLGLACLVKVIPLYLLALVAVWFVRLAAAGDGSHPTATASPARPGLAAAVILLAAAGAAIAPWAARNALVHRRLVLVETTGGKNLVRGNNPYAPSNWDWGDYRRTPAIQAAGCAQDNLVDRDRCLTGAALRYIGSHPGQFLRDAWTKLADLLNPTSFAVRHIRLGVYGEWPRPLASIAVLAIALFNAGLMAAAVVGWGGAPASRWRSLALLVVVYTLAVHLVTFGMSRFRLPLEPLLAIGASMAPAVRNAGATSRPGAPAPGPAPSRRWGTIMVLLLLLALWAGRVDGLFHVPGPGEPIPALGVDAVGAE